MLAFRAVTPTLEHSDPLVVLDVFVGSSLAPILGRNWRNLRGCIACPRRSGSADLSSHLSGGGGVALGGARGNRCLNISYLRDTQLSERLDEQHVDATSHANPHAEPRPDSCFRLQPEDQIHLQPRDCRVHISENLPTDPSGASQRAARSSGEEPHTGFST